MANTKLRNIQFYRNGQVQPIAVPETGVDLKSAYKQAEQDFIATGKHNDMLDGEILLYRFSYNGQVHTLVGVVHAPETGNKTLEVLANYDMLGGEISDAINALDATVTDANEKGDISVKVTQTDGILTAVEVTDSLKDVAHTGAAADVSIADEGDLIEATTVEDALAEIAKEIDDMDSAFTPGELIKVNFTQVDGKVTAFTTDEAALKERLEAIENNSITGKDAIVVTPDTTTGNNEVSLKLDADEKVLSQDGNGLKSTISLSYDSATTTINLKGINGADLGTIDASDFVKDGMLNDVSIVTGDGQTHDEQTLVDGKRYFKFTYKTVYYDNNGETVDSTKIIYLDVESLVDSYTAGNEWIVFDQSTNEISHKTQTNFAEGTTKSFGATTDATADAAGESVEFKVPSFTVDAAGHVTEASDKTVKVALPATRTANTVTVTPNTELGLVAENVQDALAELQTEINTINAVNWTGDSEINVDNTQHTINHTKHTVVPTESTNDGAVKSVIIPQLTVNEYGHITAIDNKTFNIDFNVPTVSGTDGQIVVTPTEGTEDVNYTVSLAEAKAVYAETVNDSFDDDTNTFTFIKNVETDDFGRVTKVETVTMSENWDCGIW